MHCSHYHIRVINVFDFPQAMDVLTELLVSNNINYTETVFLSERGVDSLQFVSQNVDAVAIYNLNDNLL